MTLDFSGTALGGTEGGGVLEIRWSLVGWLPLGLFFLRSPRTPGTLHLQPLSRPARGGSGSFSEAAVSGASAGMVVGSEYSLASAIVWVCVCVCVCVRFYWFCCDLLASMFLYKHLNWHVPSDGSLGIRFPNRHCNIGSFEASAANYHRIPTLRLMKISGMPGSSICFGTHKHRTCTQSPLLSPPEQNTPPPPQARGFIPL